MSQEKYELTLLNAVTPTVVTSSTDATPIVITATSHGLAVGNRVLIFGHTTNVAANGIFQVIAVGSANTFSIGDELTGVAVAGSGGGSGSGGICMLAPAVLNVESFRTVDLQVSTGGTATTTIKIAGSLGKPSALSVTSPRYDYPNFAGTVAAANPYSFMQAIDLDNGQQVNGSTGIVVAGTDITKNYEVNINATKYLTAFPISWSAGAITIKAMVSNAL